MANIFGGLDTPKWITIQDMGDVAARDTAQIGHNFAQALSQKRSQDFERQQIQDQRNFAMQQQEQLAKKLAPIAGALAGTQTPEQSWDVVSKNPTWMADPQTGPFVEKFLKTQSEVAKAQVGTIAGKIAIQDSTQFSKDMSAISPEDRAAIQGMSRNKDGTPSAMQWQALNTAKETASMAKDNATRMAQIEALASGEVPQSTRIDSKGNVTQTFVTPKTATANTPVGDWNLKTVTVDGRDIHYLQGPKGGIRMIDTKTGQSVYPTFKDYKDLAKAPAGDVDKELKQIATDKVKAMIKEEKPTTTTSANPLPSDKSQLKKGQKYITSRGVATWDGSQFVQ